MNNRWTDEQKKIQSDIMKERWLTGGCGNVGGTSMPKSDAHKAALSKALKGRPQTKEQKHAVGYTAIMKFNPDCIASSYQDLLDRTAKLIKDGLTRRTIAEKLGLKLKTLKQVMTKNQIEWEIN